MGVEDFCIDGFYSMNEKDPNGVFSFRSKNDFIWYNIGIPDKIIGGEEITGLWLFVCDYYDHTFKKKGIISVKYSSDIKKEIKRFIDAN